MMTIMRMRSAILTIAYYIYAIIAGSVIREGDGKIDQYAHRDDASIGN